jgi:hypothetical protein
MRLLRLRQHAEIPRPTTGQQLVGVGVGADGTIVAVHADGIAKSPFLTKATVREAVFIGSDGTRRVELEPTDSVSHVLAQPTADGGVLIVNTRRMGDELNAIEFNADGRVVHSYAVGDGVEDALLDDDGYLWVSYFDEGVYRGDPLSQFGLARFDRSGHQVWVFPTQAHRGRAIDDCYALNVRGTEAWAYYYAAFDLARVRPTGQMDTCATAVEGAKGLLIDDRGVLFLGTYADWLEASYWILGADSLEATQPVLVDVPSGLRSSTTPRLTSRGGAAYVVDGRYVYSGSVSEIS